MTYCVVRRNDPAGHPGRWQIALQAGRQKDVLPETFSSVRAAIKESRRLNAAQAALWARETAQEAKEVAA